MPQNIRKHRQIIQSDGGVPDVAGLLPTEDKPAQIGHLLDDPGLGLTRNEVDTLFDLVDDEGRRIAGRADSGGGGGSGGDGNDTMGRQQQPTHATRDVNRGLLLFLRRRGLRRSE